MKAVTPSYSGGRRGVKLKDSRGVCSRGAYLASIMTFLTRRRRLFTFTSPSRVSEREFSKKTFINFKAINRIFRCSFCNDRRNETPGLRHAPRNASLSKFYMF